MDNKLLVICLREGDGSMYIIRAPIYVLDEKALNLPDSMMIKMFQDAYRELLRESGMPLWEKARVIGYLKTEENKNTKTHD